MESSLKIAFYTFIMSAHEKKACLARTHCVVPHTTSIATMSASEKKHVSISVAFIVSYYTAKLVQHFGMRGPLWPKCTNIGDYDTYKFQLL